MERDARVRRILNWRKALRKRRIAKELSYDGSEYYDNLHQYSKNKIHCSCPDCSEKTNQKVKGRKKNYKISDQKKINQLDYEED